MRQREVTALYADGQLRGVRIDGRTHWHPTLNSAARVTSLPLKYQRTTGDYRGGGITWVYPKEGQS